MSEDTNAAVREAAEGLTRRITRHRPRRHHLAVLRARQLRAHADSPARYARADPQVRHTHGYRRSQDVLRRDRAQWPFARLMRVASVNNEMILNYIGEHVLGLPRSY
ncbi:hypothetical protein RM530_03425 [Algiphilus sp. W345]|uniref:Acyl-CoA dehydrogenase n=1 Tax=Banduia mediterranea TaxID=3075609 RepID=A0ABU2WEW8_9GAMM|nr:hypothetical protein [Algiphilus sp. W345]MDT0496416.1 hypothetical protein [Algiphilus sp. W345]